MLTKKIRIRKSIYELILEHIYRVETILCSKENELGPISEPLSKELGRLLVALKSAKSAIEAAAYLKTDETARSRELNQVISAIDALVERQVLNLNPFFR